jgi:CRP/FNR family transcriptional regulator, cyclic AMP receptor protein
MRVPFLKSCKKRYTLALSRRVGEPNPLNPMDNTVSRNSVENARRLLGSCLLFRGLARHNRDVLVARARIQHFAAGQNIFMMGSLGDSMMAVLTGTVRISVPSAEGRELLLAILHPGEFFGEIALLDGKERTADAQAVTDCELAVLGRAHVLDFLHREPGALVSLIDVLCERLRETDQHIAEVALLHLPVRLAKVLIRMAKTDCATKSNQSRFRIDLSQRELGNMIGAARENVNKCLRGWQRAGIVRMEERAIIITNRAALDEIAEQT